jgi:hypothetical protein
MTCAPFQDSNGAIVGGIGIVQDITERKLSEAGYASRQQSLKLRKA